MSIMAHTNYQSDLSQQAEITHLQMANQSLSNAIAFTGHEWRNQITYLRFAIEKLLREIDGPLTEKQRSTIEQASKSITTMQDIAQVSMGIARLSDPSQALKMTLVNLPDEILDPIFAAYANRLAERNQTLIVEAVNPSLLVWADRALLFSIVDNLLSNALKYGNEGGRICINVLERGNVDEIRILNSGQGISPDQLDRVFERFATSHNSMVDSTGIGLYFVRQAVDAHGGRLWAESEYGEWASFTFTLPRRQVTQA
jgi:signal transduction histidine kinase